MVNSIKNINEKLSVKFEKASNIILRRNDKVKYLSDEQKDLCIEKLDKSYEILLFYLTREKKKLDQIEKELNGEISKEKLKEDI